MSERMVSRADAKVIAETAADLADKALDWKARALMAEEAQRKFAGEIYARQRSGEEGLAKKLFEVLTRYHTAITMRQQREAAAEATKVLAEASKVLA